MAKQTFTIGQVLTAAQMTSLQQTAMGGGSTTDKTASYTLVAADAGTVVQMNSASATTITVNTALFSAGDTVQIQNIGAGVCTVTAGTATVSTAGSLALSQYEGGQLYFNTTSAALFFDIVQTAGMTNPLTTTGDTIYSSSGTTPARLPIGTASQILTVSGGLPSWQTPAAAASGLTLINRSTFSAVATKQVTGCFTSTYENYLVLFKLNTNTADASLKLRFSVSGTDDSGANYFYAAPGIRPTGATSTPLQSSAATSADVGRANNSSTQSQNIQMTIFSPQLAKYTGFTGASYIDDSTAGIGIAGGGAYGQSTQFDGITFFPTSGNMTGTIAVYGYALT